MVEACGSCKNCVKFDEQYCANGRTGTYGSVTKYGLAGPNGRSTVGGEIRYLIACCAPVHIPSVCLLILYWCSSPTSSPLSPST